MAKKLIFGIVLIMSIAFSTCSHIQTYNAQDDFVIEIIDNGKAVKITQYIGTNKDVRIPPQIQNLPVTVIGEVAFIGGERQTDDNGNLVTNDEGDFIFIARNQLTSITIPNSVTHIEGGAFGSNKLKSVTIPNSVTHIGNYAFWDNQLTSVAIPNSVTHIGDGAFALNQLNRVTIPNSVTHIGNYAYQENLLTSVAIPNSVTHIGDAAFFLNQLTRVVIPNSVTHIGNHAFQENLLTSVAIPNNVTHIGDRAFAFNLLTSVTIPNSVTHIGNEAFFLNQLTRVVIPNSVTHIGEGAFAYNQLTSVIIPNSVTHIGDYAFANNRLTSINVPNSVTHIGDGAFSGNQLTTAQQNTDTTNTASSSSNRNTNSPSTAESSTSFISQTWTEPSGGLGGRFIEFTVISREQWVRLLMQYEEDSKDCNMIYHDAFEISIGRDVLSGTRPNFNGYYYLFGKWQGYGGWLPLLACGNSNTGRIEILFGIGGIEVGSNEYTRRYNQLVRRVNGE